MNIPNLPTDSLYKFFAISGLAIVILSFYLVVSSESQHDQNIIRINGQISIYSYEESMLDAQIGDIKRELRKLCKICNCDCFDKNGEIKILPHFDSKDNPELIKQRQEIDGLLEKYADKADLFIKSGNQIKTQKELLFSSEKYKDGFLTLLLLLIVIGIIMTLVGFWFWYFKIQIHQDAIIKNEALKYTKHEENISHCEKQMD